MNRIILIRLMCLPVLAILLMPLAVQPFRQMIFRSQTQILQKISPDSSGLQTFVFSQSEFDALRFVRPGREFVYGDRQYDVFSIRHAGTSIEIRALWDAQETAMLGSPAPVVSQPGPVPPSFGSMGFLVYYPLEIQTYPFEPAANPFYPDPCRMSNYQDISLMIVSPPPELLTLS